MAPGASSARPPHPYYKILDRCGEGGMGVVYRALDQRLNRVVALKFLGPGLAGSEKALKRFRREAESIAALNHPNIATLYEIGVWGDDPFLAMEFLPGGSLAARLNRGPASSDELLRYAADLGGGLHFAHAKGILHRDVKPGNAMFSEHGVLKLVDFGLAKSTRVDELTRTGHSVGTFAYMAPELLRGEDATVRSDIYALGVVLYELAAGRPMFGARGVGSLIDEILKSDAVPLTSLRSGLPFGFAEAIQRATARSPEDRFGSVAEFLSALGISGNFGAEVRTMTIVDFPTGSTRSRRRRRLIWASAAAILALAGVGSALYLANHHAVTNQVLVVLPFENLGGDAANQAFCDGLEETVTALVTKAGSARNLLVVPAAEIRRGQVRSIAQARKEFNATLALTGSAQRTADQVRLTLALDDAATTRQMDAQVISVPTSEAADLQDKLAAALRSLLGYGPSSAQGAGEKTSNSAAYALYLEGVGAIEKRRADEAIASLRKALTADPGFNLARARLAEAYLWKHNFTSDPTWLALADAEINRAVQNGSGRETLMAQGMIRKATGDNGSAITLFRQLIADEPSNMEAYQLLAQTLEAAGRPAEAESTLRQAAAQRPGYWPIHNTLGQFYMNRGEKARAEQEFLTARALAPDVPVIHSNLGVLYFMMNRWADAAASFRASLAISPNALAHANLGTVYYYQKKYEESAREAQASTEMQPSNPVNWGNLGDARWQIPLQRQAARQAFERAALLASEQLSINPGNSSLRSSYALYLAKLGRIPDALDQISQVLAKTPKDPDAQFYAARVYAVAGETSRAIAALSACRALGYSKEQIEREPDVAAIEKERAKSK
ncbi:MAG TPA: protein kinase [Bryobacteraceae bacterium]|nr:protein kinase [Bryobacteraceae bacterium]